MSSSLAHDTWSAVLQASTEASLIGDLYNRMLAQPHLSPDRWHAAQSSLPHLDELGPPSSHHSFAPLMAARTLQPAGHNSPRAISHPDSLALSNSPSLPAGSPRGIFDSPTITLASPTAVPESPDCCRAGTFGSPRGPVIHSQAGGNVGPYVSPSRNLPGSLPLQPQLGLPPSRTARRRAAARQVTYSEQLDLGTDSDSDSGRSKVRRGRPKQGCPQRPRRQNSKPARFCGGTDSDAASDQDGSNGRKHHNPW